MKEKPFLSSDFIHIYRDSLNNINKTDYDLYYDNCDEYYWQPFVNGIDAAVLIENTLARKSLYNKSLTQNQISSQNIISYLSINWELSTVSCYVFKEDKESHVLSAEISSKQIYINKGQTWVYDTKSEKFKDYIKSLSSDFINDVLSDFNGSEYNQVSGIIYKEHGLSVKSTNYLSNAIVYYPFGNDITGYVQHIRFPVLKYYNFRELNNLYKTQYNNEWNWLSDQSTRVRFTNKAFLDDEKVDDLIDQFPTTLTMTKQYPYQLSTRYSYDNLSLEIYEDEYTDAIYRVSDISSILCANSRYCPVFDDGVSFQSKSNKEILNGKDIYAFYKFISKFNTICLPTKRDIGSVKKIIVIPENEEERPYAKIKYKEIYEDTGAHPYYSVISDEISSYITDFSTQCYQRPGTAYNETKCLKGEGEYSYTLKDSSISVDEEGEEHIVETTHNCYGNSEIESKNLNDNTISGTIIYASNNYLSQDFDIDKAYAIVDYALFATTTIGEVSTINNVEEGTYYQTVVNKKDYYACKVYEMMKELSVAYLSDGIALTYSDIYADGWQDLYGSISKKATSQPYWFEKHVSPIKFRGLIVKYKPKEEREILQLPDDLDDFEDIYSVEYD